MWSGTRPLVVLGRQFAGMKRRQGYGMTDSPDDALLALRQEVERLLGDCVLRLQYYELLMKTIVTDQQISGSVDVVEGVQLDRTADVSRNTLGTLVGQLLGSFLIKGEPAATDDETEPAAGKAKFRIRLHIGFSAADFDRIANGLRELVALRNGLVHNFIAQHDLRSLDGCREAQAALIAARTRIKHHVDELRQWWDEMMDLRQRASEDLQRNDVRDALAGNIALDATLN